MIDGRLKSLAERCPRLFPHLSPPHRLRCARAANGVSLVKACPLVQWPSCTIVTILDWLRIFHRGRATMPKQKVRKQKPRRLCGAMEAHMRLVESDPEFRKRRARIHAQTEIMVARNAAAKKVPVTIPVVVHVVSKTAAENI